MKKQASHHRGYSLLEVMIALAVLSIGLLGLASLQVQGMRFNTDSYLRTQATILAYDIIDRMRANTVGSDAGVYCLDVVAPADPCATNSVPSASAVNTCGDTVSGCASPAELARYDISRWYALQDANLPVAATRSTISRSIVTLGGGNIIYEYTVTMRWQERGVHIEQQWVVEI